MKNSGFFRPADIMLPEHPDSFWPVIACDQFTSDSGYWDRLDIETGSNPSTLRLMLPEAFLSDAEARIPEIVRTSREYLEAGFLKTYSDAMILVERTLPSGMVRRGVVGAVKLDEYPSGLLRPTEETVPDRVPPRAAVRRAVPVDMPHIMLFTDSPAAIPEKPDGPVLYDVELRGGGGRVRGSLMSEKAMKRFTRGIMPKDRDFSLVVGDGNHSLAAAKAAGVTYALAEVVSVCDPSIVFEPIYRVIKNADPGKLAELLPSGGGRNRIKVICGGRELDFFTDGLPVAAADRVISGYKELFPGAEIDYIHGLDALRSLTESGNNAGFEFDGISKDELFGYVAENGVLPRKAFSMGTAYEKRYYMELMRPF